MIGNTVNPRLQEWMSQVRTAASLPMSRTEPSSSTIASNNIEPEPIIGETPVYKFKDQFSEPEGPSYDRYSFRNGTWTITHPDGSWEISPSPPPGYDWNGQQVGSSTAAPSPTPSYVNSPTPEPTVKPVLAPRTPEYESGIDYNLSFDTPNLGIDMIPRDDLGINSSLPPFNEDMTAPGATLPQPAPTVDYQPFYDFGDNDIWTGSTDSNNAGIAPNTLDPTVSGYPAGIFQQMWDAPMGVNATLGGGNSYNGNASLGGGFNPAGIDISLGGGSSPEFPSVSLGGGSSSDGNASLGGGSSSDGNASLGGGQDPIGSMSTGGTDISGFGGDLSIGGQNFYYDPSTGQTYVYDENWQYVDTIEGTPPPSSSNQSAPSLDYEQPSYEPDESAMAFNGPFPMSPVNVTGSSGLGLGSNPNVPIAFNPNGTIASWWAMGFSSPEEYASAQQSKLTNDLMTQQMPILSAPWTGVTGDAGHNTFGGGQMGRHIDEGGNFVSSGHQIGSNHLLSGSYYDPNDFIDPVTGQVYYSGNQILFNNLSSPHG